jgi:Protein of unknown function (DUF3891)
MVIGCIRQEPSPAGGSAWAKVEAAQRRFALPCLLVPQPAHAVLAGDLADVLTCFGELPPEIKRAIQMHDTGWASMDAQQIERLRSVPGAKAAPISFLAVPPLEVEAAWTASIKTVESFSKAGAVVVSRHFSLIAQHDPAHRRFLQAETSRQQRLGGSNEDVERWTAALGFCDLVSLYLLSGLGGPEDFPLAHPSSREAQTAPQVTLQVEGQAILFSPQTARSGSVLSIQAMKHPLPSQGPRAETLTWEVR